MISAGSPVIKSRFSRAVWPDVIVMADLGVPRVLAKNRTIALFAAPSTGGAAMRIDTIGLPAASAITPTI